MDDRDPDQPEGYNRVVDSPPADDDSPRAAIFDQVEEWRADFDEAWFDCFARCVMCAFLGGAAVLALIVLLR